MAHSAFLSLDKIVGGVAGGKYERWIDLKSFAFSVTNGVIESDDDSSMGRQSAALMTRTEFGELTVTKFVDASSPFLMKACAEGKEFREASIDAVVGDSTGGSKYAVYKFGNVRISSFTPDFQGADRVGETVVMRFKVLTQTFFKVGKPGSPGEKVAEVEITEATRKA